MKGHPPTSDFVKTSLRAEISLCTCDLTRTKDFYTCIRVDFKMKKKTQYF